MDDSRNYPDPSKHPEVKDWVKSLHDSHDPLVRYQFADWLQEHGYENAAKWQRLFADQGKFPHKASEEDTTNPAGWWPGGWRGHPIVGKAALPTTFENALEGDRWNRVIFPHYENHPEEAALTMMHKIPYDKYNKEDTAG